MPQFTGRFYKRSLTVFLLLLLLLAGYANWMIGVNPDVKSTYQALQQRLEEQGYRSRLLVISGRRWAFDNWLLSQWSGAASNSRHLDGLALDILVLDIDRNGKIEKQDVEIVRQILDLELIGARGGVGTYTGEKGFLNRQMVHFDLRGVKARWDR